MDRICVALDVEMTGPQAGVDEIIEVAGVKFQGQTILETFSQLVKPRQSLPLKITRLTGITESDLADAPRFNDIAPAFVSFIKNYPLVGHSVRFDLDFLNAQGMKLPQTAYDTFDLATLLLPQAPIYRLSALAEYLGIPHPSDHRALNDADVSRQVFLRLVAQIEAMELDELAAINRLMAKTDWSLRDLFAQIARDRAGSIWQKPMSTAPEPVLFKAAAHSNESPLRPTGQHLPLVADTIASFFAPDGIMSHHFAAYEQRTEQAAMAQGIAQTFNTSDTLLVEAGTGTGKSMAYLIPAALFALQRGERVIVSTNTLNLQDQLFFKDIPDVQRMLHTARAAEQGTQADPLPLSAALLKGRSNYLCLRRYKALCQDEHVQPHEAQILLKAHLWLKTTTSGDRAELLLSDEEQIAWGRINVPVDTCTGPRCRDFRDCFFFKARRQAEAAHLVVVNHALLLADLATESQVLPPYDHLIIDEAHNLEDVATDQFSFQIDQPGLLQFLDSLYQSGGAQIVSGLFSEYRKHFDNSAAGPDEREQAAQIASAMLPTIEHARRATYDCFNRLLAFVGQEALPANSYDARLRLTAAIRQKPLWEEIEQAWENLRLALAEISSGLGRFATLLVNLAQADLLDYDELRLRVEWLRRYVNELAIQMGYVILGNDDTICWLSLEQHRQVLTLNAAPLSVAGLLQSQLFAEKQTTVLTSATLTISESFDFVKSRLGLQEPAELRLDSPFDYEQQALVYIPDDIPEPNQRGYQQKIEDALIDLCSATGGRTLALFTATSALRQTYAHIQEALEEQEITVLGQGIDGSRRALLERFKEWPRTVLLGTSSFWEGVDVVGDALSVLVITKLPFSVPSDPIFASRSEQFQDPFLEYAIPQSILRFKQGFGRLIRSKEDRGIVVVLDKRLISKKYGQQFLQSLPATSVRTGSLKQLPRLAARFIGGRESLNGC